jgi:hypothetical protein
VARAAEGEGQIPLRPWRFSLDNPVKADTVGHHALAPVAAMSARLHLNLRPGAAATAGRRRRPSLLGWMGGLALTMAWGITPASAQSQPATSSPGVKGAQVYCFMRSNGNIHEVSWAAAYALIKRQGGGLFKTSPEHASVMITEAVVQNPNAYPDCARHLGDLYTRRVVIATPASGVGGSAGSSSAPIRSDRYGN